MNKSVPTPEPGGVSQSVDYEAEVKKVYPQAFLYYVEQTFSESILVCHILSDPSNRKTLGKPQKERNGYLKDLSIAEAWADAYSNLPKVHETADDLMPRITEGESKKEFLERVLRQLRYELERKATPSVPSPEPKVEPAADLDYERLFKRDHPSAILTAVAFEGWGIYVSGVNGAYNFNKRFFDRHEDAWRDAYSKLAKEEPSNLLFCPGCEDDFDPQYDKHVVGDQVYCCDLCYQRNGKPKPVVNPSPVKVGEPQTLMQEVEKHRKELIFENQKLRQDNAQLQYALEQSEAKWNAAMAAKSGTATEHKIYWSESTVGCSCGWKFEFGDKGVDYGQEKYDAHVKSGTGDGVGTATKLVTDSSIKLLRQVSSCIKIAWLDASDESKSLLDEAQGMTISVMDRLDLLPLTPEGK